MTKEHFRTIAILQTDNWDSEVLAKNHIREVFELYLFREGEATHICSFTPNSRCDFLSNEFIFSDDATEEDRDRAYSDLYSEAGEDGYFGFIDLDKIDRRKVSDRITVQLDGRTFKGGLRGDDYLDAIWDEARESVSGNSLEPDILSPEVFAAWEAEQVAKRRALNLKPCYSDTRTDALPLFLTAALPMRDSIARRHGVEPGEESAARGEAMKNPQVENLRQFLNTGATICNIGQIDRKAMTWLNRQVRAQRVIRYQDCNRYPVPKFCYYVPIGVTL